MADDTEDEWKEYPLWSRILTAGLFLAMGIGVGAALGGWSGVVAGVLLALLALFVPPVLAFLVGCWKSCPIARSDRRGVAAPPHRVRRR